MGAREETQFLFSFASSCSCRCCEVAHGADREWPVFSRRLVTSCLRCPVARVLLLVLVDFFYVHHSASIFFARVVFLRHPTRGSLCRLLLLHEELLAKSVQRLRYLAHIHHAVVPRIISESFHSCQGTSRYTYRYTYRYMTFPVPHVPTYPHVPLPCPPSSPSSRSREWQLVMFCGVTSRQTGVTSR